MMQSGYQCPKDGAPLAVNPAWRDVLQCPLCGLAVSRTDAERSVTGDGGGDADGKTA